MVPGINLGFNTANDPAAALFSAANFPGASDGAAHRRAGSLRAPDRPRGSRSPGRPRSMPETNHYSFLGKRRRAGKLDIYSAFVQDSWRLHAGADGQRRAALGRADCRSRRSTTRCRRRALADICGISGLGAGGIYSRVQLLHAQASSGGKVPEFSQFTSGHARLRHRLEQRRAERRRRLAAQRGKRLAPRRFSAIPIRRRLAAATPSPTSVRACGIFTGVFGPNPGSTLSA